MKYKITKQIISKKIKNNFMKIPGIVFSLLFVLLISYSSFADEGMWIPSNLEKIYPEMQKLGLKLTLEQMYQVDKP